MIYTSRGLFCRYGEYRRNMNINLREEETSQYILFYQEFLDEVQSLNSKVTDVLNEVMKQSKYDKLQCQISEIIDAYMETIVNDIESSVFRTWQESEGSLRACLRIYRAGDAADEVCAQLEHQMEDLMKDILRIEKADLVITERPIVSEEGLVQLEDICRTAQTEIQNLKVEYTSQVSDQESGNDIYGTLRPLIEGVVSNMEVFFEASLNSFLELHAFVSEISGQLHNIEEERGGYGDGDSQNPLQNQSKISDINERIATSNSSLIDTLFITGNGFDMAHGINSSYIDFRNYLNKIIPENVLKEFCDLFNNRSFSEVFNILYDKKIFEIENEYAADIIDEKICLAFVYAIVETEVNPGSWGDFENALNFKVVFKDFIEYLEGGEINSENKLISPVVVLADNKTVYHFDRYDVKEVREVIHNLSMIINKSVCTMQKYFRQWIVDNINGKNMLKSQEKLSKLMMPISYV